MASLGLDWNNSWDLYNSQQREWRRYQDRESGSYHTSTTAGGTAINYYNYIPYQPISVSNDYVELTYTTTTYQRKRRTLFGRYVARDIEEANDKAVFALKWLRKSGKNLTKKQQEEFKALAEKAFEEALKNLEIGAKAVQEKFENEMEKNLNVSTAISLGYKVFITDQEIDKFRDHLPSNKELVIDEIDEYEIPLPRMVQESLKKAKETKLFSKFLIFWIREVKDPILFGVVNGDKEKFFFIDEWDEDVSIEDFLKYK